jgi:hypothetical protein
VAWAALCVVARGQDDWGRSRKKDFVAEEIAGQISSSY